MKMSWLFFVSSTYVLRKNWGDLKKEETKKAKTKCKQRKQNEMQKLKTKKLQ